MLLAQDEFEVFVVDNASGDNSVAMVEQEFPQVHLVANKENVGFGRANNQVLADCRGEYVLLLNPDTIVLDRAIDRLLDHAMKTPNIAVMGCRLLNLDRTLQRWTGGAFPSLWNVACHYLFLDRLLPSALRPPTLYLDLDYPEDMDVDWISGAVMLLKKECLGDFIFDETFFMYGEDMECCYRMKKSGWRVIYSPVCSIIHIQGASMQKQEGEILLSSLKGLRTFYMMVKGKRMVWMVDGLTITGFIMRWFAYSILEFLKPGKGYGSKAGSSRKYIQMTYKLMKQS